MFFLEMPPDRQSTYCTAEDSAFIMLVMYSYVFSLLAEISVRWFSLSACCILYTVYRTLSLLFRTLCLPNKTLCLLYRTFWLLFVTLCQL